MSKIIHIFPNGQIEVPKPRKGKPCSYRWTQGWSQVLENGFTAPVTLRNLQATANRHGFTTRRHKDEASARAAL